MSKRATNKDVAKVAGVSTATVSYVINGKSEEMNISEATTKKVLQAINLLGYSPNPFATSLKTNPARIINVRSSQSLGCLWDIEIMCLVRELGKVSQSDYSITFSPDTHPEKLSYEACICIGMPETEFRALAGENFVPLVLVDAILNDPLFYQVTADYGKLKKAADLHFGGERYAYITLEPSCGHVKKQIQDTFDSVTFVSDFQDLSRLPTPSQNVIISQASLNRLSSYLGKHNVYYYPSQDKAAVILDCVVSAIKRTPVPDEAHFIKV